MESGSSALLTSSTITNMRTVVSQPRSTGFSIGSTNFARKHSAWQNHKTCHLPPLTVTDTRQGSRPLSSMSFPQKQHGPCRTCSSLSDCTAVHYMYETGIQLPVTTSAEKRRVYLLFYWLFSGFSRFHDGIRVDRGTLPSLRERTSRVSIATEPATKRSHASAATSQAVRPRARLTAPPRCSSTESRTAGDTTPTPSSKLSAIRRDGVAFTRRRRGPNLKVVPSH